MNTPVSSIDGPGWYLISSSSNGSFVDVIQNYATKTYPKATYKIYDIAFAVPSGWTDDEGNATFKKTDWDQTTNINDPSVIMEASLGYWIKILSYNSNIVTNQSQLLIGCTVGYIAISNDGKGWQNINPTGGTSIGPLPSEVPNNIFPYFSSFLFEGKSANSSSEDEAVFISTIKNIVQGEPNSSYISEIYQLYSDNSVSTKPIKSITNAFIYNANNLTTDNNYYWLLSGFNSRFLKSNPTPFYNTTNDGDSFISNDYTFVGSTDWNKLNTSSFPLWAAANMNDDQYNAYFPGENSDGTNNKYYIKDIDSSNKQWFPFNVNSSLITSDSSYYILGANGYYFIPVIDESNSLSLHVKIVDSAIYYTSTSNYDDIDSMVSNASDENNTPWASGFSYGTSQTSYQVYPKVSDPKFPAINSIHNLIEGVIDDAKYVFAIQRSNNINDIYKNISIDDNGNFDLRNVSENDINATCSLCYIKLDDWDGSPGTWTTLTTTVNIDNPFTSTNGDFSIAYIQNIFYIKDDENNNQSSSIKMWYMSCLNSNLQCILLKSTNPIDFNSWTIAYDGLTQSIFPISPSSFTTEENKIIPLYYQVKTIIKNDSDDYIIGINGSELALTPRNPNDNPVGTYYATLNSYNNFANINESIPNSPRNNTFNSIIKRNINNIVYEIKNNETQTIIPNFASLGYAINVLAIAGGGASGTAGSITPDNNTNRSIINYSGSGAGGAAASFVYGNSNNITINIDSSHNVNFDFGTDGSATLNCGGSGKAFSNDNADYVAPGGTSDNSNISNATSKGYFVNDILASGFADGLDGLTQKTIVYNNDVDYAAKNASKYSPDGGDGGIVTTDIAGNNYYGIGGSGTYLPLDDEFNAGGNAYILVRYEKWNGPKPENIDVSAFSVAVYKSISDQTITSYRDYILPSDPSQYPMLIYLNELAPNPGEEASGRIMFNYPIVSPANVNIILSGGAGGGGGGASLNTNDNNNPYYVVPNNIIDRNKTISSGPTPGWSGRGGVSNTFDLIQYDQDPTVNANIADFVYKITVGGGGKGGKKYNPSEGNINTWNGGNGIESKLYFFYKNQGTDEPGKISLSAGSPGGLNGYYSNNLSELPDDYDISNTGAPYGTRGNYAGEVQFSLSKVGLTTKYGYPGGIITNNQLLTQLGGDGGGGTSTGIGAGGSYGNGGLPGLYSNVNESGIHGYYGGGGGGGMGGDYDSSDGGNGSNGMAFIYLSGPPDYNAAPISKTLKNSSDNLTPINNKNTINVILASDFEMPTDYANFNFVLYGAGGNGATSNDANTNLGGGGSGAFMQVENVPYSINGYVIKEIKYGIGASNVDIESSDTTVEITYNNGGTLTWSAGPGDNGTTNGGGKGGLGGFSANSAMSDIFSDTIPNFITAQKGGVNGGYSSANSGESSGKTVSGAGGSTESKSVGPVPSSETYQFTAPDGKSYSIISQGSGTDENGSPKESLGFGAGGAGTPGDNNQITLHGTPGCIVYYLSAGVAPEPEPETPPKGDITITYNNADNTTQELTYDTWSTSIEFEDPGTENDIDIATITFNTPRTWASTPGFLLVGGGGAGGWYNNSGADAQFKAVCAGGGAGGMSILEFRAFNGQPTYAIISGDKFILRREGGSIRLKGVNNTYFNSNAYIYVEVGGKGGDIKGGESSNDKAPGGQGGGSGIGIPNDKTSYFNSSAITGQSGGTGSSKNGYNVGVGDAQNGGPTATSTQPGNYICAFFENDSFTTVNKTNYTLDAYPASGASGGNGGRDNGFGGLAQATEGGKGNGGGGKAPGAGGGGGWKLNNNDENATAGSGTNCKLTFYFNTSSS